MSMIPIFLLNKQPTSKQFKKNCGDGGSSREAANTIFLKFFGMTRQGECACFEKDENCSKVALVSKRTKIEYLAVSVCNNLVRCFL